MAQFVETNVGPAIAGEALARYLRVKFNGSGRLVKAGLADRELGTCELDAFADGDKTNLRYRNAVGTRKVVANAAITKGADLFTAAAGKVGASLQTGYLWGTAMEASGADGDIIEGLPIGHGDTAVP